jgi:ATP synthase protein I
MADPHEGKRPGKDAAKPVQPSGSVTGDLASRIAQAQAESPGRAAAQQVRRGEMTGVGRAFRMASEFVAAIVVGTALGFGIDSIFSTRPWATVILLLLGFAAGVLNVVRATSELNAATAVPPDMPAVRDDEDE